MSLQVPHGAHWEHETLSLLRWPAQRLLPLLRLYTSYVTCMHAVTFAANATMQLLRIGKQILIASTLYCGQNNTQTLIPKSLYADYAEVIMP